MPMAPIRAREALSAMGPLSGQEKKMLGVLALCCGLWIFGNQIGVSAATAGLVGMSAMLLTGTLTWDDCLRNKAAWDMLLWVT